MTAQDFQDFFSRATGIDSEKLRPHPWQAELAQAAACTDRLIRIPTGFGKTFGVLCAWLWHRIERADAAWPNRLVWCLPMRVLAEQTEAEVRAVLSRLECLWDGSGEHAGKVGVHVLMGGSDAGDWHLYPEHPAVLIGTQDMLLSRALNRGYGAPRGRWPMEFGLLNHDCLWVMDEVQLMDVGLATSGQLQAFRQQDEEAGKVLRPCQTWWMSATLQRAWLGASPETATLAEQLPATVIPPEQRHGALWDDVEKRARVAVIADAAALASVVAEAHRLGGHGAAGPTLVVVNTVKMAVEVHAALSRDATLANTELRLVHSRFRAAERGNWRSDFLNRAACTAGTNRIIIATQVIEAGVDISAALLITQLAPWPSLVQRFGRAARWGGCAEVIVVDMLPPVPADADGKLAEKVQKSCERAALPYPLADLEAARAALTKLAAVAPRELEEFEDQHPEWLARLYPYAPRHLLLRHELDELFDTVPDLSGADIDISRFIRSGEERDLQVFWADIAKDIHQPDAGISATRAALCNVPFLAARDWLCGKETGTTKAPHLAKNRRAWVWDYLDGVWRRAERRDLYPGQTVLVAADSGGYDQATGWNPDSKEPVVTVALAAASAEQRADASEDDESLSAIPRWQTIASHGGQVGREVATMAEVLQLAHAQLFDLAGRWHDAGKALAPFQNSIVDSDNGEARPQRADLAKAPERAWVALRKLYPDPPRGQRHGFRHELASTLALFAVLIRHQPEHPALLGPWRELLSLTGMRGPNSPTTAAQPNALEQEILNLDADGFDLLAYLVCSHHGKVRVAWHASPADQRAADSVLRLRGVRDGESLPALTLMDADGGYARLPPSLLQLDAATTGLNARTGRGWTERVLGLLARHGPFALAYQEALLRAADQRASRAPLADPLLRADNADHGLETSHCSMAQTAVERTAAPSSALDPAPRGALHGDGGRAGQRTDHPRTPAPSSVGTRFLDTALGILSYAELTPHLAERVGLLELDIADRRLADRPLDSSLLLDLHRQLCTDLLPGMAGHWRNQDVQVGNHLPPAFWQVPSLMHAYAADLQARLAHANDSDEDRILELLVYAEGRLLNIHPFADFNGRITRLFLIELLYRLDLPIIDPATRDAAERARYFAALRAFDGGDPRPLAEVWRQRFEQEDSE